jgi:hypothetical protein
MKLKRIAGAMQENQLKTEYAPAITSRGRYGD